MFSIQASSHGVTRKDIDVTKLLPKDNNWTIIAMIWVFYLSRLKSTYYFYFLSKCLSRQQIGRERICKSNMQRRLLVVNNSYCMMNLWERRQSLKIYCVCTGKKTYRKYGFIFWWNFRNAWSRSRQHSCTAIIMEKGMFFQFHSTDFAFVL